MGLPELLCITMCYNYCIITFQVGFFCSLPNKLFFFVLNQLVRIAKVLGTDELFGYLHKYHIELDTRFKDLLGQ